MNRRGPLFACGVLVGLLISAALNLLPYWSTYEDYRGDGAEVMGFPFTFRRQSTNYEFRTDLLVLDIAAALAIAIAVGWSVMQLSRVLRRPGIGFPVLPPSRNDLGAK